MKRSKKLLAGFLAACMLLVMVPVTLPAYAEELPAEAEVASIVVEPITVIENYFGMWEYMYNDETQQYDIPYFEYQYDAPYVTVYLQDGSVLEGYSGVTDKEGTWHFLSIDQTPDANWKVGTQTVNATIMGYTGAVEVTVLENPVERVEIRDLTVIKENGGSWDFYHDDSGNTQSYYSYHASPSFVAYLKDGTVMDSEEFGGSIPLFDSYYSINSKQSYFEPWLLGENKEVVGTLLGVEDTFTVNVIESPVESITFEPYQVPQYGNGEWRTEDDPDSPNYGKEYFFYYIDPEFTIHFKDGSSMEVANAQQIFYEGVSYEFSFRQDYETQLTLGENEVPFSIMGFDTVYPVEVIDSPIERVDFDYLEIIENTNGFFQSEYDYENDVELEYFYYYLNPTFTVYFKDGTSQPSEGSGITYQGEWYNISCIQDYAHQLQVGTNEVPFSLMGYETTFYVYIVENPIKELHVSDITVIENTNGEWVSFPSDSGEDESFYRYYINPAFSITLNDDTLLTSNPDGQIYLNGTYYTLGILQDNSHNWTLGENTATAELMNVTATFTVNVIKSPIQSITFDPYQIAENTSGYWETNWEDPESEDYGTEYFYYSLNPSFTVTFTDGSTADVTSDNGLYYEGISYFPTIEQSYENRLTKGNNEIPFSFMGYETTLPVEVTDSPIDRIEFEPLEIIENTNGFFQSEYDYENDVELEYFHYYLNPTFTVYFKDGSSQPGEGDGITYQGEWYGISYTQDYAHRLTSGTNTIVCELMGFETSFEVYILENPIRSVTLNTPALVIKDVDGDWSGSYDSETGEYMDYFHYSIFPSFTVTMKDGSTTECQSGWFDIGNYSYCINIEQSHENQLQLGTQTVTAELMNFEFSFELTVVEPPIASITVVDMTLIENTGGYYSSFIDHDTGEEKEVFFYEIYPKNTTITLKDGTVVKGTDISFNNQSYNIDTTSDQSFENPWELGEHTVTAELMGVTTTFTVNIVESPYQSLEILSVDPLYEDDYDYSTYDAYGNLIYIYSVPTFTYKVTLKDGTSFTGTTESEWGENLSLSDDQYSHPWTVGGINEFTVTYANLETTGYVNLLETPNFSFMEQDGGIYITGCRLNDATIDIPAEIDGLPVLGLLDLGNAKYTVEHLILPDSLISINEDGLGSLDNLKTITVGSGLSHLDADMFQYCNALEAIYISEDNETYLDIDGIVYNKEITTLVYYPLAKGLEYHVPATVTNIDALSAARYAEVNIIFDENSTAYTIVDGVTYSADMTRIIFCDRSKTGAYVMPETVTEIAASAFGNCTGLTDVTVSPNVTEIVYGTFVNCAALTGVTMPDSVVSIGKYAFANCETLTEVDLPDELEVIDEKAFFNAGLTALTLPDSVFAVEKSAFEKTAIATLDLGTGLKFIGSEAFYGIPIKTLVLPDSFTESGDYIFGNCKELTSITFGSGLKGIAYGSFAGCTALKSVTIPENIAFIWESAFRGCSSLETVVFENDGILIDENAFRDCALKEVKLGNKVTEIAQEAFSGNELTKLVLPESVTSIAYGAFKNCTNLAEIDVPAGLVRIDSQTFANTAWYNAQKDGPVYLEHIFYDYKNLVPTQSILVAKAGTTVIADYALDGQYQLEHITLPEGLITLGEGAFYDCFGLTELIIPEGVTHIENHTFANCENLTRIVLPSTIEYIGDFAFVNCYNLQHILYLGTEEQLDNVYIGDPSILMESEFHYGALETVETVKGSCTEAGYTLYTCSECDEKYIRYEEAAGHTLSGTHTVIAPTCTAYGSETGYCTTCRTSYSLQLPKAEHTYAEGACSVCGLIEIRSNHPYADGMDETWTYTEEGANQITLTFHPITWLELDYDFITIMDGNDEVIGTFTGTQLAGADVTVPGDTVKIRMTTDDSVSYYGFEVTGIQAEFVLINNDVVLESAPGIVESDVELVAEITEISTEIQRPAGFEESKTMAYDITLEKDGVAVQPSGEVQVSLPVPETMDGASCQVFHLADDGSWTNMNASYQDGRLLFSTDHFSQYVIMEAFDTSSVVRIMQYVIGMDVDINIAAIDQNGDGMLSIIDAVKLLRALS